MRHVVSRFDLGDSGWDEPEYIETDATHIAANADLPEPAEPVAHADTSALGWDNEDAVVAEPEEMTKITKVQSSGIWQDF